MKEEITAFLRAKTKNLFHDYFEGAKDVLLEDNNFSLLGDFLCLSVSCFFVFRHRRSQAAWKMYVLAGHLILILSFWETETKTEFFYPPRICVGGIT